MSGFLRFHILSAAANEMWSTHYLCWTKTGLLGLVLSHPFAKNAKGWGTGLCAELPGFLGCHCDGSLTRPMKRIAPLALSRMRKRNGWSALKTIGGGGGYRGAMAVAVITTAVAAAASVPLSSTSMYAL